MTPQKLVAARRWGVRTEMVLLLPAVGIAPACGAKAPAVDERPRRRLDGCGLALAGRIQAICIYDGDDAVIGGLGLTGFGRFLLDAARPTGELLPIRRDFRESLLRRLHGHRAPLPGRVPSRSTFGAA